MSIEVIGKLNYTYRRGETDIDQIETNAIQIFVKENQVYIENTPANSMLTIYDINGRIVLAQKTDGDNKAIVRLDQGIYILTCKNTRHKFIIKP